MYGVRSASGELVGEKQMYSNFKELGENTEVEKMTHDFRFRLADVPGANAAISSGRIP